MSSVELFSAADRWCVASKAGVTVALHVQPGAKRSRVVGEHGERLKVALQAPPVDGKANQALVKFLAGVAGVPKSAVELIAGETSREKRLEIRGVESAGLIAALAEAQNA